MQIGGSQWLGGRERVYQPQVRREPSGNGLGGLGARGEQGVGPPHLAGHERYGKGDVELWAITLNACTIPMTVPRRPSMGETLAIKER